MRNASMQVDLHPDDTEQRRISRISRVARLRSITVGDRARPSPPERGRRLLRPADRDSEHRPRSPVRRAGHQINNSRVRAEGFGHPCTRLRKPTPGVARSRQRDVQVDASAKGKLNDQDGQVGQVGLPQACRAGCCSLNRWRGCRLRACHVRSPPVIRPGRNQDAVPGHSARRPARATPRAWSGLPAGSVPVLPVPDSPPWERMPVSGMPAASRACFHLCLLVASARCCGVRGGGPRPVRCAGRGWGPAGSLR
jgi:hypothetical protein